MKFLILLLLFIPKSFSKDQLLPQYCDALGGEVVNKYKCPKSGLTIPFQFCTYKNNYGDEQFFDGCTGPTGGHSEIFYPHCIKHDLCYHHEPMSNGKTQKTCDRELKEGLIGSCNTTKDKEKCEFWAKTMYKAVRSFGTLAYNCANYEGKY